MVNKIRSLVPYPLCAECCSIIKELGAGECENVCPKRFKKDKEKTKKGFSFIEVMIVIALIGLIAAITIPSMLKLRENSVNDSRNQEKYSVIIGRPISVALGVGDNTGSIAAVLEVDNKRVLAISSSLAWRLDCTEATALIQSEIANGNEGQIELRGNYTKEGKFVIKAIKANSLSVEF